MVTSRYGGTSCLDAANCLGNSGQTSVAVVRGGPTSLGFHRPGNSSTAFSALRLSCNITDTLWSVCGNISQKLYYIVSETRNI